MVGSIERRDVRSPEAACSEPHAARNGWLLAVLLPTLVAALVFALYFLAQPHWLADPDAQDYAQLGRQIVSWRGPTSHEPNRNGTAYYRIQGPRLFIEFSPQGVGGDPSNHVHTMYRDPTNDYARALLNKYSHAF